MSKRPLRPALALLLLGILTATVFGVASGQASRKDDIPTLKRKLAACRQDVALDREAIDYGEKLLALAKRNQLVVVFATVSGAPGFISFEAARDMLILSYVTGRITKAAFASKLHSLATTAAKTLKLLKGAIEKSRDERDADQNRCAKLAQELKQAQGGGGGGGGGGVTLTLQPVTAADVTNTHPGELTINASGKSAHFDNSKGSGAHWQIDYSWDVPTTITPGKSYQLMLHDEFLGVQPEQPLGDQMNAIAPDFAQAIQAHWPDNKDVSKTFTVPVSSGFSSSSDYTIKIGFTSSSVTYHYKK